MLTHVACKLLRLETHGDEDGVWPLTHPRSNSKTVRFITFLTGAKSGLWMQVIARDWGRMVPVDNGRLVFDDAEALSVFPNAQRRLDEIWPKCPHAEDQSMSKRLQQLSNIVLPRALTLAGEAAHLLPHSPGPATLQHHLCDSQQQHRDKLIRARERRCTHRLRVYTLFAWRALWHAPVPRTSEQELKREELEKRLQQLAQKPLIDQCCVDFGIPPRRQAIAPVQTPRAETPPAVLRDRIKRYRELLDEGSGTPRAELRSRIESLTNELQQARAFQARLRVPQSWS